MEKEKFEFNELTPELKQDVMERQSWGVSIEVLYNYRMYLKNIYDEIAFIQQVPDKELTPLKKWKIINYVCKLAKNLSDEAEYFDVYTKNFKGYLKRNFNEGLELLKEDISTEIDWANAEVMAYRAYEDDKYQEEFNDVFPDYARPTVPLPEKIKHKSLKEKRGINIANDFPDNGNEME